MSRVHDAFSATAREGFLPENLRDQAWRDQPLPIGYGATNSQPSTVRAMLELLEVPQGAKVLDIGSGSGWTTALLAHLTGASGTVVGVELEPELVEFGNTNLAVTHRPWASIEQARPDIFGLPDDAPFDRILVSAMADELPSELVDQLAPNGILVIPVDGHMLRITRQGEQVVTERQGRYVFVPLRRK